MRLKNMAMGFMWFEKLLVQVQINHIAAPAVIKSFQWQLPIPLPGWNMMPKPVATGTVFVGANAIHVRQGLSAPAMRRVTN
jgi:hypothetical protein